MAWEKRRGKGAYYTRSRKVNGRVTRQYVGHGPAAELAAAEDALRREERRALARQRGEERARVRGADTLLLRLCGLADLVARAELVARGFTCRRGEWRRKQRVADNDV